jgi:hypothetical protein
LGADGGGKTGGEVDGLGQIGIVGIAGYHMGEEIDVSCGS